MASADVAVEEDTLGGARGLRGLVFDPIIGFFTRPLQYKQAWITTIIWIVIEAIMLGLNLDLQWHWFPIYTWILVLVSPYTRDPNAFYSGSLTTKSRASYSFTFLSSSAFISWVFAKSVYNASTLGYKYGIVGGVGYMTYYIAFFTVAGVVYRLRIKGYSSLPEAIMDKYGVLACLAFCAAVVYRLFNEIWSNAIVVGSFYGDYHTHDWWVAVCFATAVPMIYVFCGGMKSSLLSDLIQALLAVGFLIVVLVVIGGKSTENFATYNAHWTMKGGVDFLLLALVQGALSYPFFDPVLTDRAFLASPKVMVASFFTGGTIAGLFILLFSFLGIYSLMDENARGVPSAQRTKGIPAAISQGLGLAVFSFTNLISLTSSVSTVDSTFACISKVFGVDLFGLFEIGRPGNWSTAKPIQLHIGRAAIVVFAIAGTLPLLAEPKALDATTISGTVVLGLGPPILLMEFMRGHRPLAFHLPFWFGAALGIAYQDKRDFSFWKIGDGSYANLLGTNVYGSLISFGLLIVGLIWNRGEEHTLRAQNLLETQQTQNKALYDESDSSLSRLNTLTSKADLVLEESSSRTSV